MEENVAVTSSISGLIEWGRTFAVECWAGNKCPSDRIYLQYRSLEPLRVYLYRVESSESSRVSQDEIWVPELPGGNLF